MVFFVRCLLVSCSKFEITLMGELTCFLGLQSKQSKEGTFISQKYCLELLKKFVCKIQGAFQPPWCQICLLIKKKMEWRSKSPDIEDL